MSSQLYTIDLHALREWVNTAWQQTWGALLALAEVLPTRKSSNVSDLLDEAEEELKEAKNVLKELKEARKAVPAPAEARGTLGDEDDEELWKNANEVEEAAKELEEQKEWAKQCQKWLQAGHRVALVLMALCGAVLSFDAVRTALGVAEDRHLLLVLGGVALSCQVAEQALGTSWRQLHAAAREHRDKAQDLRDRARQVKSAKDNAKAARAIRGEITRAVRPLGEVTDWLGMLVAAVKEDMNTRGQEFRRAEKKLKNILKVLGKASGRHGRDMARRLEEVWAALKRQGDGTGMGHGGGAVTPRGTGNLALGTPGEP